MVKARKEHKCDECSRIINRGEKYEYVFGIYSDSYDNPCIMKTCSICLSIREAFFCDGFLHGDIIEAVREHIRAIDGKVGFDCLEILTDEARKVILKLMEETMEDLDE